MDSVYHFIISSVHFHNHSQSLITEKQQTWER
jgi:hypothetical protein